MTPTSSVVAVFCNRLLPASETFILSQARALPRSRPVFVGVRAVADGLATDPLETYLMNALGPRGWLREIVFRRTGRDRDLERFLRRHRPRVVHAHFGWGGLLALPFVQRLGLPLVVTAHGSDARPSSNRPIPGFLRFGPGAWPQIGAVADRVLAVSDAVRRDLMGRGVPESKIEVHYIGVDLEREPVLEPAARHPHTVLFVGRLDPVKSGRDLIEAVSIVQRDLPQTRLVLVGRGPEETDLLRLGRHRLPPGSFELTGHLPPEEVRRWMERATLLALPSRSEGLPTVVLEAQASGLPVVATDVGGTREAVRDGITGRLVPPGSPPSLAEALKAALLSPDLRLRWARAAHERARQTFDLRRQSARLEEIYDSLEPGAPAAESR